MGRKRSGYVCILCGYMVSEKELEQLIDQDDGENCPLCGGGLEEDEPEDGYNDSPPIKYDRIGRPIECDEDMD